jgi:hypothetical protein
MNPNVRSIIFIIILMMLSVLIVPVFMGASMMELPEEDDPADTDFERDDFSILIAFPMSWIRIPVHQMSVLFRWGISIFALFGVYVGGRSKRHLFNDRTLDHVINFLIVRDLKTALTLRRAVFNFRFGNISSIDIVDCRIVFLPNFQSQ